MLRLLTLYLILSYSLSLPLFSDSITVSGSPAALVINTATAGQDPNSVTNTSRTYSVSTSTTVRRITGRINSNMPANTTLQISLVAPTGATSLGLITMTTTAANLVTGIPINTIASGRITTYTFSATAAAAKVTNAKKTVTFTLQ